MRKRISYLHVCGMALVGLVAWRVGLPFAVSAAPPQSPKALIAAPKSTGPSAVRTAGAKAGPAGARGGPMLKPGFDFDPADYPSLSDYSLVAGSETIDLELLTSAGLLRVVILENTFLFDQLKVTIGVSPISSIAAMDFMDVFKSASQIGQSSRLVTGASLGLSIGDDPSETLVGAISPPGTAQNEIAFRRNNIFVAVETITRSVGPTVIDLTSMATEIDLAVAAIPDVSFAAFEAARPLIDVFSAVTPNLAEAQLSDLNVVYHDPGLPPSPVSELYIENDGDVIPNVTDKYRAGSKIGAQTLTLLVYNRELLYRTSNVVFTVTP